MKHICLKSQLFYIFTDLQAQETLQLRVGYEGGDLLIIFICLSILYNIMLTFEVLTWSTLTASLQLWFPTCGLTKRKREGQIREVGRRMTVIHFQ